MLSPAGSDRPPVLKGTLESPLNDSELLSPGFTGLEGWVLEDSWPVSDDMIMKFAVCGSWNRSYSMRYILVDGVELL